MQAVVRGEIREDRQKSFGQRHPFLRSFWRGRPYNNSSVYPLSDGHGVFGGYHVADNRLKPSCGNLHGAVYAPFSTQRPDAFLCIVLCRLHANHQVVFRAGAAVCGRRVECCTDGDGAAVRRERMLAGGGVVLHADLQKWPLVAIWTSGIAAAIFLAPGALVMAVACAVSIVIAFILLTRTDAYVFYRSGHTRQVVKHKSGTASVFVYLLRYLTSNASYRVNTVALCVFSCVLPFILGQFDDFNDMPMGFAVLSLNTPICTLISGDPDTEQGLRAMPGQVMRFCTQYCLFIFCANSMISGVYLICWQFRNGGVGYIELLTAVLFALQSSILSVALEWLRPLRRWKVETDLWHHPRKYLVPAVMMLIAGVISLYPIAVWVWLGAMIVEVSGFAFLKNTREINKEM